MSSVKELHVEIEGISPLLMHNIRLMNPLDPGVKKIKQLTSKRKGKTEADMEELMRLEVLVGLYVDAEDRPIIPSTNLEAMLRDGAKANRLGKAFQAGVFVDDDALIVSETKKKGHEIAYDPNCANIFSCAARVGQARVMRNRAIFRNWSCEFTIGYRDDLVNAEQVLSALEHAGSTTGILDQRPKYGRFQVVK